jgi:hypothetical protein
MASYKISISLRSIQDTITWLSKKWFVSNVNVLDFVGEIGGTIEKTWKKQSKFSSFRFFILHQVSLIWTFDCGGSEIWTPKRAIFAQGQRWIFRFAGPRQWRTSWRSNRSHPRWSSATPEQWRLMAAPRAMTQTRFAGPWNATGFQMVSLDIKIIENLVHFSLVGAMVQTVVVDPMPHAFNCDWYNAPFLPKFHPRVPVCRMFGPQNSGPQPTSCPVAFLSSSFTFLGERLGPGNTTGAGTGFLPITRTGPMIPWQWCDSHGFTSCQQYVECFNSCFLGDLKKNVLQMGCGA